MGLGISIFLLVIGAILTFAVTADVSGLNIHAVGVILMAAALLGLFLSTFSWRSLTPWVRVRRRIVNPGPVLDGDQIIEERHIPAAPFEGGEIIEEHIRPRE